MRRVRPCLRIVITLVKSFIGTGIIFLPGSFRVSGIISGNILSALVCVLAIISIRLLVKCCQGKETLGELAERVWGRSGLILVDASIFFSQLGFSTVYMIFVSHNIQEIIYSISSCQIEVPILKLICFQMVVYLPFIFLRDIESLSFPSVLANVSVFSVLGVIVYYGVQNLQRYPLGRPQISRLGNIYGAGLVLGTSAFNYEGIALVLPIRNSTPESLIRAFPAILTFSMVLIGIFTNFFASLVYYSFGDDTASPVTENILSPKAKIISLIVYSSAIMFSIPLQLFPSMGIIEKYVFQAKSPLVKKVVTNLHKIKTAPVSKVVEAPERRHMKEVFVDTDESEEDILARSTRTNPARGVARTPQISLYSSPLVKKNSENVSALQNGLFSASKVVQLVSVSEGWDSSPPISGKKVLYSPVESSASKRKEGLDAKESQRPPGGVPGGGDSGPGLGRGVLGRSDKTEDYLDELEETDCEGDQMSGPGRARAPGSRSTFHHSVLRALVSYSLVLLCGVLAYNFEDELGSFVTITGGLLCVPLAFVYPPLFYLCLNRDRVSTSGRVSIGLLVLVGGVISFISVAMAILSWETNPRSLVCVI